MQYRISKAKNGFLVSFENDDNYETDTFVYLYLDAALTALKGWLSK